MQVLKFASPLILSSLVVCCIATLTREEEEATTQYFSLKIVLNYSIRLYYCDIEDLVKNALIKYPLLQSGDVVVDDVRMLALFQKLIKIAERFHTSDSVSTTLSKMQWIAMVGDEEGNVVKAMRENMTDDVSYFQVFLKLQFAYLCGPKEGQINYDGFKFHYCIILNIPEAKVKDAFRAISGSATLDAKISETQWMNWASTKIIKDILFLLNLPSVEKVETIKTSAEAVVVGENLLNE